MLRGACNLDHAGSTYQCGFMLKSVGPLHARKEDKRKILLKVEVNGDLMRGRLMS